MRIIIDVPVHYFDDFENEYILYHHMAIGPIPKAAIPNVHLPNWFSHNTDWIHPDTHVLHYQSDPL